MEHEHQASPEAEHAGHPSGGGHSWVMIVCCIPMLAIALVLVATGVVSVAFLIFAVACTLMMALMMRGSDHSTHRPD